MPLFRVWTLDISGNPKQHVVEITGKGFSVDKSSGNCLRLRRGCELALGQYAGYPSNLRRDGIPVVSAFGVLEDIEQDSLGMEVLVQTRISQLQVPVPTRTRRLETKWVPVQHIVAVTQQGFWVDWVYGGDCILWQVGKELVLMRSRETLETKMRGKRSLGPHIAIAELVEAFGIVVIPETEKAIPEPSRQIPLHPA